MDLQHQMITHSAPTPIEDTEYASARPISAVLTPNSQLPDHAAVAREDEERKADENRKSGQARAWLLFNSSEEAFMHNYRCGKFSSVELSLEKILHGSRILQRDFWSCPQFADYRMRKPKDQSPLVTRTRADKEQTWTELREIAFCRALVAYPARGRKKSTREDNPKLTGRNEDIAVFMNIETGDFPDLSNMAVARKQISSHIQVLKPYVSHNPCIMRHFTEPKKDENYQRDSRKSRRHDPYGMYKRRHASANVSDSLTLRPSRAYASSATSSIHMKPTMFVPRKFIMAIYTDTRTTAQDDENIVIIHRFTQLKDHPHLASIPISNIDQVRSRFQQLSMYSDEELRTTQIISAEATIKIPTEKPPEQAEVGIELDFTCGRCYQDGADKCQGCLLMNYDPGSFELRVRFYEDGRLLSFQDHHIKTDGRPDPVAVQVAEILRLIPVDEQTGKMGNLQFGSDFWARKLSSSMATLRKAQSYRASSTESNAQHALLCEAAAKDLETGLARSFSSLTAVQEISARRMDTEERQNLLLVCWRFELCTNESASGFTSWRNVEFRDHASQPLSQLAVLPYQQEHTNMSSDWPAYSTQQYPEMPLTAANSVQLQQPFTTAAAYETPDFSNEAIAALCQTAIAPQAAPTASSFYPEQDFDFSHGADMGFTQHETPVSMGLDTYPIDSQVSQQTSLLYQPTSTSFHMGSYHEQYFPVHNSYGMQAFAAQDEAPYSEAGAQEHEVIHTPNTEPQPQVSQHGSFAGPVLMSQHQEYPSVEEDAEQDFSPTDDSLQQLSQRGQTEPVTPEQDPSVQVTIKLEESNEDEQQVGYGAGEVVL